MKFRKFMVIGGAAAVLSLTAACGSDDSVPVPTVAKATSASSSSEVSGDTSYEAQVTDPKKRPTVEVLNEMLQTALDPKVPAKDKTDLVEGSEVDPALFNQLVKLKKENPDVTYEIKKPIKSNGPKRANFNVMVTLPGNAPTPIAASIVYDDGRWKLSKQTVCPLLSQGDVETPLCEDQSAAPSGKSTKSSASSRKAAPKSSAATPSK